MVISSNFKKLLHRRTFKKRLFPSVHATPEVEQDQSLPVPLLRLRWWRLDARQSGVILSFTFLDQVCQVLSVRGYRLSPI